MCICIRWVNNNYEIYRIAGNFRGRKLSRKQVWRFRGENFHGFILHCIDRIWVAHACDVREENFHEWAQIREIREGFLPRKFPALQYKDPIGSVKVPKTDGETLYTTLCDVCIRSMLPLEKCRGQAYDGAANMSGHIRGVAAWIKTGTKGCTSCALFGPFTQSLPPGCFPHMHP